MSIDETGQDTTDLTPETIAAWNRGEYYLLSWNNLVALVRYYQSKAEGGEDGRL